MNSLKVLDVTLRDGGCVNDFNFGQAYMEKILAAQEASGVDIIEMGYIDENKGSTSGRTQYINEQVIPQTILKHKKPGVTYVAMMDYGKFDVDNLHNKTVIAINTFIAAGINLILNFILIPQWGALAAAYTTVVAYICSSLIHYAYCKKLDKELFPINIFIFPVFVIICMILFQYATLQHVFMRWIGGSILTLIYVAIVLIRHKEQLRIVFRQEGENS